MLYSSSQATKSKSTTSRAVHQVSTTTSTPQRTARRRSLEAWKPEERGILNSEAKKPGNGDQNARCPRRTVVHQSVVMSEICLTTEDRSNAGRDRVVAGVSARRLPILAGRDACHHTSRRPAIGPRHCV